MRSSFRMVLAAVVLAACGVNVAGTDPAAPEVNPPPGSGSSPANPGGLASDSGHVPADAGSVFDGGVDGGHAADAGVPPDAGVPTDGGTGTSGFVHPGLHVSLGKLEFVKAKIAAGAEPWTTEFNRAKSSSMATRPWTDQTVSVMACGSNNDVGCTVASNDALAAYTLSLLYYYSGDRTYAARAIQILDAWSAKLKSIQYIPGSLSTNGSPLRAAWLSELFPRAAEILRYTPSGWTEAEAQRFGKMLNDVMLPLIRNGWYGGSGNWNTSMANGTLNIGVYNNDRAVFDQGLTLWRNSIKWTFYLTADGPVPLGSPDYTNPDGSWKPGDLALAWHSQGEFGQARENGLTSETCRDFGHTQMQLASVAQGAETARMQGVNLYGEGEKRILATYEFIAKYLNQFKPGSSSSKTVSVESWLCHGSLIVQDLPTWEMAYNHFATAQGIPMPETLATLERLRSSGADYTNLQMSWETLTHSGTGDR